MRTLIAGVGYSNMSDLSVGPIVAAQLQRESWPAEIEIDDFSYGPICVVHRFAEASPPYTRFIVVASADRKAQAARLRCYRWDGVLPPADEVQDRVAQAVTGVIDLDNLLIVTRQFGALPDEVFVIEVQPAFVECGEELSPTVAALLPEIRRQARACAQSAPSELVHWVAGRLS